MLRVMKYPFIEKYVFPFLITSWIFIIPVMYWTTAILFFMLSDLALRVLICKRNGIPIESFKMWRTVYKFGTGFIFILVAYACQLLFMEDIPIMKIVGSFLILVELKSIDEKAKEITGYSIFSLVIEKLTPKK